MINNLKNEFQPTDLCKKCKGKCCQAMSCHYSPTDFKEITFEYLKNIIEETNYIAIDWWEGNPIQYYLRIKTITDKVVEGSWGNTCKLWNKQKGCPLTFDKRPLGARAVQPKETHCISFYEKEQCKNDWNQYRDILLQLVEYFNNK